MYEFVNATLKMASTAAANGSAPLHQSPGNDSWQTAVAQELLPTFADAVTEAATDWLSTFMATLAAPTDGPDNMAVTAAANCSDADNNNNLCSNAYNNGPNVTAALRSAVTAIAETATTLVNNTTGDVVGIDVVGGGQDDKLFDWHNYSRCDPDNPQFNCTPNEYVEYLLGPQRLPLYHVLMVTIIYGGIFITGILGNVLVCVVIVRHPTMHSATNYYLFSLAVSDLLYLLFGLPAEIFLYWHQYPYLFGLPFCKIRAFISEASTYVSVLTIVAFSMERFLAICHPLHLYTMSGFKRAVRIIAALWIISFISAIPFGLLTNIRYIHYPDDDSMIPESAFCSMEFSRFPWIELSFCVFFVIPMILISILYACMGKQIRLSATAQLGVQQGSMHRESSHSKSRKAVIRMLAAVVITFFICWLPFHIQRLWILYATSYDYFQDVNEWMFCITGFAYYVSCTINPILYNVMSRRYRVAFKDILCGKRRTVYFNYTFSRDQSSFRETNSSTFARGFSVRGRSERHSTNMKEHNCLNATKSVLGMKGGKKQTQNEETKPPPPTTSPHPTNIIVVVDTAANVNGRPKVYTEHEAQECLLREDHETCI